MYGVLMAAHVLHVLLCGVISAYMQYVSSFMTACDVNFVIHDVTMLGLPD